MRPVTDKPTTRRRRKDGEATRKKIYDTALRLIRADGFDKATMRRIAKEAGVSLGAAYHYFASKQAIVFAYYEEHQGALEQAMAKADEPSDGLGRLGLLFHTKVTLLKHDRVLLRGIARGIADPEDPTSAFSSETAPLRERAFAQLSHAVRDEPLPKEAVPLVVRALWTFQMATLLYLANDESEDMQRTHGLIDGSLAALFPLLAFATTPMFAPVLAQVNKVLTDAKLIEG